MNYLNLYYTKLVLVYYLSQNNELEKAKEMAYVAIRNGLGVIIFFNLLFVQSFVDIFIADISIKRNDYPIYYLYLGAFLCILGFLYCSKRILKPKLRYLSEVDREKISSHKRFYLGYIISLSLFGGLCFVVLRLLYISFK